MESLGIVKFISMAITGFRAVRLIAVMFPPNLAISDATADRPTGLISLPTITTLRLSEASSFILV